MNELSDSALMQAVCDGRVEQLGVLFARHHARVHAMCFRLSADRDVADDLTQETFLRVFRYCRSYRGDGAFTTWLYRLAYNVWSDTNRRALIRARRRDAADDSGVEAVPPAIDERQARLEAAIARLSPDERVVIILGRYHELRYSEIARVLGCTTGAARTRAHRALNALREMYHALERQDHDMRAGAGGERGQCDGPT